MTMAQPTVNLEIFRYQPDGGGTFTFQRYQVPYHEDWVVLDAINYIKDQLDGTLAYRWSCRMGVCGSCGMMINGVPKLSCATFLKEYYPQTIRVEPLANFPVERDLVITLDDFMKKLSEVHPWIVRTVEPAPGSGEYRQTPAELDQYKQFSMCLNCMLCYAACPMYGLKPLFLGPAAIALAHRYNLDSRDEGRASRQDVLGDEHGVWDCTLVGECTTVCPADVDPAAAIQQIKLSTALDWIKRTLRPGGGA